MVFANKKSIIANCFTEVKMKIIIIWAITFFLFFICLLLKRKVHIFSLLIMTLFITFFSLLTPNGKILFSIEKFNFTLGAILDGLYKSSILISLQLFSKIIVSSKIKFPGKIGIFINDVFFIYEKLSDFTFFSNEQNYKPKKNQSKSHSFKKIKNFSINSIIEKIDEKLLSLY